MAKKSAIENNKRKVKLVKKFSARRKRLLEEGNSSGRITEQALDARKVHRSGFATRQIFHPAGEIGQLLPADPGSLIHFIRFLHRRVRFSSGYAIAFNRR